MGVLFVYLIVGGGVLLLALLLYMRSRASRRGLKCPQCGEYVRIELMDANQRCSVCGAPLEMTGDTHAQP